jgi:hypothetical protein
MDVIDVLKRWHTLDEEQSCIKILQRMFPKQFKTKKRKRERMHYVDIPWRLKEAKQLVMIMQKNYKQCNIHGLMQQYCPSVSEFYFYK